jgi:nitrite reductase (NADH) small subunit
MRTGPVNATIMKTEIMEAEIMEAEIMKTQTERWIDVGGVEDVPARGARIVAAPAGDIAIFKAADGTLFALRDKCPHKGGPLSQGIVHGHAVTCPLHNWVISLQTGSAQGADKGCTPTFPIKVINGRVLIAPEAMAGMTP